MNPATHQILMRRSPNKPHPRLTGCPTLKMEEWGRKRHESVVKIWEPSWTTENWFVKLNFCTRIRWDFLVSFLSWQKSSFAFLHRSQFSSWISRQMEQMILTRPFWLHLWKVWTSTACWKLYDSLRHFCVVTWGCGMYCALYLLVANKSDVQTQLNLALALNRSDLARKEIFTVENRAAWQVVFSEQIRTFF